jgi:drug/metabolite transporter (DMT)-like permease
MSKASPNKIIEGNDINASNRHSLANSANSSVVRDMESSTEEDPLNMDKLSDLKAFKFDHNELLASR